MNTFPEDPKAPKTVKTQQLNYIRKNDTVFNVFYPNGVFIGELMQLEDGYYNFFPDMTKLKQQQTGGCWSAWVMREIADQMDRLNKDWHDQLMRRIK